MTNILVVFPQICYIEVFDITNPRYNEQIYPVPWHFVKSRFHCISSMRNPFIDIAFSFKLTYTDILKCDGVSVLVLEFGERLENYDLK